MVIPPQDLLLVSNDVTKQKIDFSSLANSSWFGWLRINDFDKDSDIYIIGDGFGYVPGQKFTQHVKPEIHSKNDVKGTLKASIKYQ